MNYQVLDNLVELAQTSEVKNKHAAAIFCGRQAVAFSANYLTTPIAYNCYKLRG